MRGGGKNSDSERTNIEYGAPRSQEIRILIKVHNLLTIVAIFQFGGFVGLLMTVYMLVSGAI